MAHSTCAFHLHVRNSSAALDMNSVGLFSANFDNHVYRIVISLLENLAQIRGIVFIGLGVNNHRLGNAIDVGVLCGDLTRYPSSQ